MKLLKKIKKWFSTEEKCYICRKVITTKKNPKSIKIVLGYSPSEWLYLDSGKTEALLKPVFYLCEKHREDFELFIYVKNTEKILNALF